MDSYGEIIEIKDVVIKDYDATETKPANSFHKQEIIQDSGQGGYENPLVFTFVGEKSVAYAKSLNLKVGMKAVIGFSMKGKRYLPEGKDEERIYMTNDISKVTVIQ